jgi:hypothetical protein
VSSFPLPPPLLPAQSLPPRLRGGDLLAFSVQTKLPLGYSLFYILTAVIAGVPTRLTLPTVAVSATGVASFSVPGTTTTAWLQGRYNWLLFQVDSNGNRDQLAEGEIYIEADPAGTAIPDPRSYNQKLLDSIRCVLAGAVSTDVTMYKIGGREVTKMPRLDLMKWEALIAARVRRERIRRGDFVPTRTLGITFGGRGQV